jgi:hypothetical protein
MPAIAIPVAGDIGAGAGRHGRQSRKSQDRCRSHQKGLFESHKFTPFRPLSGKNAQAHRLVSPKPDYIFVSRR